MAETTTFHRDTPAIAPCRKKLMIKTKTIDYADHLQTPEDIAAYLEAMFEDGDPELIAHALGIVARSHGMTEIAKCSG